MRRGMWIALLLAALVLAAAGCLGYKTVLGSGRVAEETREVSGFSEVDLATVGTLFIERGEQASLHIEGDDNLFRYLETRVRGNTLQIGSRDRVSLVPMEPLYYTLTVTDLESVVLSGLGGIQIRETLDVPKLSVRISGGGSVEVEDLRADRLNVEITGLGDLYVDEGQVGAQDVLIGGGGNYRARGLESDKAAIRVTGLGSATVRVRDELDVTITGGGSVRYIGSPSVSQTVTGLGRVEQIRE
jgi:hypothetical protein